MTVSSTTSRNEYNGNGATTAFSYTFRILDEDHVAVYVDDVLKTITTHYTVSGVGVDGGGTITFLSAPAAGTANVVFLRNVPLTQATDYVENDPFPAETHEDALDKLTMISQQLQEQLDRTIILPPTSTVSDLTLPTPSAGKALLWNATEDGLENSTDNFNDIVTDAAASAAAASASASAASGSASNASTSETNAAASAAAAAASAATIPTFASLTGEALNFARVAAGETSIEYRTPAEVRADLDLEVGTDVQAYDADTAKTDVAQNWAASQRSAPITDNDGSFDLSGAGNNYKSAPTSAVAITFTNIAANEGKSGYLTLTNGSNYAYTAHANTKITTTDLAKITATGTYVLPYLCDGTDVLILGVWTKP